MLSATFCGVKSMYELEPLSLPPVLLWTVSCGGFQYPPHPPCPQCGASQSAVPGSEGAVMSLQNLFEVQILGPFSCLLNHMQGVGHNSW